jgi:phage terminase large subunit-like protein
MGEEKRVGRPKGGPKSKKVARLSAAAVRGFSQLYLTERYDGTKPIPAVHDEWWESCCGGYPRVAIAAPRAHAKSTAITHAYALASIVLKYKKYVVIVANTEDVANDFLAGIRDELRHNEKLRDDFGIVSMPTDGATNCIVEFEDGHRARIRTKGAGQKVRGMIWNGTRPDLIIVDDLEDDEAVENSARRDKLKSWFMKALVPCMSRERGEIRVVGTILHNDSLLSNLMGAESWRTRLYKAHSSFDDFSNLLWPEMWPEEELKRIRQEYIDLGDPEGYSQEYLNDPSDLQNPFFRDEDFLPMDEDDHKVPKRYYVGVDFALSDANHSDFTVMVVGGYDSEGMLHIVDERRVRTNDASVIVDDMFYLLNKWNPEYFIMEGGVIANAVTPVLKTEMRKRNKYCGLHTYTPIQDKRLRASSIQQRFRVGGVRYDTLAPWYEEHKHELKRFPRGKKKDRVDAIAWLGRGIDEFVEAPTKEEYAEEIYFDMYEQHLWDEAGDDHFSNTGY